MGSSADGWQMAFTEMLVGCSAATQIKVARASEPPQANTTATTSGMKLPMGSCPQNIEEFSLATGGRETSHQLLLGVLTSCCAARFSL